MKRFLLGLLLALLLAPTLAAAADAPFTPATPRSSSLDKLRGLLGNAPNKEPLPPDEAYRIEVVARDPSTLVATITPAPDYYVYRDRIHFRVESPRGLAVRTVTLPDGETKRDRNFGTVVVYHHPIDAVIQLSEPASAPVRLHASYQGCNEPLGVCYPPIEKVLTVQPVQLAAVATPASVQPAADATPSDHSETARMRGLFAHGTVPLLAAFFGFGILLAFTPCMLPMIPILSGIVVGQRHASRARTLALSGAYVLGMALTYAAAGVGAGLAGTLLSAFLQSAPWRLSFAAVFVLLALAMFGWFRLQLPSTLQSALARAAQHIPGGHLTSVFVMGMLSALIMGPCVAAPLAGALLYIGQTRDALIGGAALFSLALGMGIPLLAVGAAAHHLSARAGVWGEAVQRLFGVVMLALAIYTASPALPFFVQQLLWAALLMVCAMFLRAIDPLPADAPGHRRFLKGFGVIGLVLGIATLIGALAGSDDLLRPLAGLRNASERGSPSLPWKTVRSVAQLDAELRAARGREVMLDFWAEWCISCKEMDRLTFADAQVRARLAPAVLLRADVTANSDDDQAMLRRFGLFGPPGTIFFDRDGRESAQRVIGYEPPRDFLDSLARAWPRASPSTTP